MRSVPISSDPPSFVPSLFTLASQSAPQRITPSVSEGIRALCVLVCACMCETDREKGRERIKFWQREATNDPWPTFMGNSLKQKHMEWNEFGLKHYLFYYLPLPIATLFIVCFQLGGKWGFFCGPETPFHVRKHTRGQSRACRSRDRRSRPSWLLLSRMPSPLFARRT